MRSCWPKPSPPPEVPAYLHRLFSRLHRVVAAGSIVARAELVHARLIAEEPEATGLRPMES
jgi:hypothetical protein